MKLTTKSEYCLLALIYMARRHGDGWVRMDEICEAQDIPRKYLEQLFHQLKQRGYVMTRRGSAGGHKLAQAPSEITVAEILRLMDGALAPSASVSEFFFAPTPLQKEARIHEILQEIRDEIASRLERVSLADLV